MVHALYDFKSYPGFLKQSGKRTLLYGTLVGLLYLFLVSVLPFGVTVAGYGGVGGFLQEIIPDFHISGGELWMERPIEIASLEGIGVYFRVDTQKPVVEELTETDLLAFDKALILDADQMLLKTEGEINILTYKELELFDMDRSEVIQMILPYVYVFFAASAISILFAFWLEVVIVALLGNSMASFMRRRQRFRDMMKLAVHAMTAVVLVEAVYAWLPIAIPFFWVISYGLPLLYIRKGLKCLDTQDAFLDDRSEWRNE